MRESEEIWKDIEGYEGYQVSSLGRVRSLDRVIEYKDGVKHFYEGKMITLTKRMGYLDACLHKDGKRKIYKVHRLVAEAFIPNPDNLPQVNHINEFDKTDNRVENLEWCTAKYNVNYGTARRRIMTKLRNNQKSSKKVYQYTLDNQLVKVWQSSHECERNGFNRSCVSSCCRNKDHYNTHKGYIWRYE